MVPNLKSNTTLAGGAFGLTYLSIEIAALVDSNPDTVVNYQNLVMGVGLMVIGYLARSTTLKGQPQ